MQGSMELSTGLRLKTVLFTCTVPDCGQKRRSKTPPECPVHLIFMVPAPGPGQQQNQVPAPRRARWAVEAAGHQLTVISLAGSASPAAEAGMAAQWATMAYRSLLAAIGTIPADQVARVVEMTVVRGMPLSKALHAVGA